MLVESLELLGLKFPDLSSVEPFVDINASERSPRRVRDPNQLYHTDSPSELTQSGRVDHQRFSTVSPSCPQLPYPNLGGKFIDPEVEDTTLTEHSSSDYSSSRSTSAVSESVSTQTPWDSRRSSVIAAPSDTTTSLPVTRRESESQQPNGPSITVNDVASGSQSRSLKAIKSEILESMIQYLLEYSAGGLRPVSH